MAQITAGRHRTWGVSAHQNEDRASTAAVPTCATDNSLKTHVLGEVAQGHDVRSKPNGAEERQQVARLMNRRRRRRRRRLQASSGQTGRSHQHPATSETWGLFR